MKRFLIRGGFLIVLFAIRYSVELFKCGSCDKNSCETFISPVQDLDAELTDLGFPHGLSVL
jgi:hypothetical protein